MISYAGNDGQPLFAELVALRDGRNGGAETLPIVLMHGGGPDHQSLLPLAHHLVERGHGPVLLPDVRGYGRSVCRDPARHTWAQYADDVASLLDTLDAENAVVGGAGLGGTIALRAALAHPKRCAALVLISVEDIEDDIAKAAEIRFMDAFAKRVRSAGIEAGWAPILPDLAPVIGSMVREAVQRADLESVVAAAAIGRDRSFRTTGELASISVPTLVFAGMDQRHPRALAEAVVDVLPRGELAPTAMTNDVKNAVDFGEVLAPVIAAFLTHLNDAFGQS